MPGMAKLSLVEGGFEELALELATYLDGLKEGSNVTQEITPMLANPEAIGDKAQETDKDAVLKKLVTASAVLNSAPERELQAAYNLLVHLVCQSENPDMYMNVICKYLSSPITSSPHNGSGLALGILGMLFNAVDPDDDARYHVLMAIVKVIKSSSNYETLQPQLKTLDAWLEEWEMEPEEGRALFLAISNTAASSKAPRDSYSYLLKALRTLQDEPASSEARELSLKALKSALLDDKHFDFQDLTAFDSIQALRKTDPVWSELLELFSSESFDDLTDFKESNPSFFSESGLDEALMDRKMRLLTLASLGAQASQSRTLPYSVIAKALNVPQSEVEMWVIDSIRSGLVEGKLSQQKQEFLIHRSTYRVFGENQWREVASRLETWRSSLVNVLNVVRAQKEEFIREKEAEMNGPSVQSGQGYRPDRRQRNAPMAIEVE